MITNTIGVPLQVLILENSEDDAILLIEQLRRGGYEPSFERVETAAEMQTMLDRQAWDIVLSGYRLPEFSCEQAFALVIERGVDLPFIIVSGAIDESTAATLVHSGMHDYVLKDNLARLTPAIERELREAKLRRENKKTSEALREANLRLQALSSQALQIQEEERRSVARELHDEIGQALTAVKIHLDAIRLQPDAAIRARRFDESIRIVDRALEQVRRLSLDLRPPQLDDLGLVPALRWHLDRQARAAGLTAHLFTDRFFGRLRPELETVCFRVTQEAITNVLRHARAHEIWVELRQCGTELQLTIRDDGEGFEVADARKRALKGENMGLLSMQERVTRAGGQLELTSRADQGTEITAGFPGIFYAPERLERRMTPR